MDAVITNDVLHQQIVSVTEVDECVILNSGPTNRKPPDQPNGHEQEGKLILRTTTDKSLHFSSVYCSSSGLLSSDPRGGSPRNRTNGRDTATSEFFRPLNERSNHRHQIRGRHCSHHNAEGHISHRVNHPIEH